VSGSVDGEHHRSVTDRPESSIKGDTQSAESAEHADSDSIFDLAIQTCCGSLVALEASAATVDALPGVRVDTRERIHRAKELLTASVEDLFALNPAATDSNLLLGFVARQRRQGRRN
jgi:hypothetical protein